MKKRDKSQIRLLFLSSLIVTLIFVYISVTWLFPTLTRYIKREQDEIRAHYTALHLSSTGEGKTIALENGVGYIEFDLRNYEGENVTERDIVYTISKPTIFYSSTGNALTEAGIAESIGKGEGIYVLDVWKTPVKVEDQTYLYDVEIVQNSGEVISEGVYGFSHEKLETGAKGKTHRLTCKITARDPNRAISSDRISIVVKLSEPYEEVLIINMNVSDRLITFSHKNIEVFDVPFDKIYVQTADLFAYTKNDNGINRDDPKRRVTLEDGSYYEYTPYAMKLSMFWTGYLIDEIKLEDIYIGTSNKPGSIKDYDTVNQNGETSDIGTIPNPEVNSQYLNINKSRIARLNSVYDISGHRGEMVLFMPQGGDIYFHFAKTAYEGNIYVKIEVYVKHYSSNGTLQKEGYELYSEDVFGGYLHNRVDGEDFYTIASYK